MLAVFRYLLIVQNLLANFLDLYADHFYMIPESYGHRDGIAIVEKNRFRLKKTWNAPFYIKSKLTT